MVLVWYACWGPGYYCHVPDAGKVKIVTHDKDASVYIDGGYVGPVAKGKNLPLRSGNRDVELRDPSGNVFYRENVQVIAGRTTEIHPNPVANLTYRSNHLLERRVYARRPNLGDPRRTVEVAVEAVRKAAQISVSDDQCEGQHAISNT